MRNDKREVRVAFDDRRCAYHSGHKRHDRNLKLLASVQNHSIELSSSQSMKGFV